jgi:hypothetical protein
MTTSQTTAEFIAAHGITMTAERTDTNPHMDPESHDRMDHWRCTFRRAGRSFTTYFSMGFGHNGKEPTATEVLDCLADDGGSVASAANFEDWARDMGWDPDSRRAEKTFRTIERQTERLKRFLDDDQGALEKLFWNTERL